MNQLTRNKDRQPLLRIAGSSETDTSPDPVRDYWDAVPRDGPWVFVADANQLAVGHVHGRWVDPTLPADVVKAQLGAVLGPEVMATGAWAIIDQVNVGPAMLPEGLRLDDLRAAVQQPGASQ